MATLLNNSVVAPSSHLATDHSTVRLEMSGQQARQLGVELAGPAECRAAGPGRWEVVGRGGLVPALRVRGGRGRDVWVFSVTCCVPGGGAVPHPGLGVEQHCHRTQSTDCSRYTVWSY